MNLMMNSIDAMKDLDGTRKLSIQSQRGENGQVLISVSDTGRGSAATEGGAEAGLEAQALAWEIASPRAIRQLCACKDDAGRRLVGFGSPRQTREARQAHPSCRHCKNPARSHCRRFPARQLRGINVRAFHPRILKN